MWDIGTGLALHIAEHPLDLIMYVIAVWAVATLLVKDKSQSERAAEEYYKDR